MLGETGFPPVLLYRAIQHFTQHSRGAISLKFIKAVAERVTHTPRNVKLRAVIVLKCAVLKKEILLKNSLMLSPQFNSNSPSGYSRGNWKKVLSPILNSSVNSSSYQNDI